MFTQKTFRLRYLAIPSQLGIGGLVWWLLEFPNGELVWVHKISNHSAKYEYSNVDTLWFVILATVAATCLMLLVRNKTQWWIQLGTWSIGVALIVFAGLSGPDKRLIAPAYVPGDVDVTF